MLKGETTIELTNVKTGEKEVIKKHNMITSALNKVFETIPTIKNASSFGTAPYVQSLLGGILLFDGTIEENVNTLFAPTSVEMTACGVYNDANGTGNSCRGGYNTVESVFDQTNKTMKFVYDFATNQGNGQIASVCLTNRMGGFSSYGNADIVDQTGGGLGAYSSASDCFASNIKTFVTTTSAMSQGVPVCMYNDKFYYIEAWTTNSITLMYTDTQSKSASLFDNVLTLGSAFVQRKQFPVTGTLTASLQYGSASFDPKSHCIYFTSINGNTAVNADFLLCKINLDTLEMTEITMKNTTGVALYPNYNFIFNGCFYIQATNWDVYKIEIANQTNVVKLNGTAGQYCVSTAIPFGDRLLCYYRAPYRTETNKYNYIINTEKNTIKKCETYDVTFGANDAIQQRNNSFKYDDITFATSAYNRMFLLPYLATINNLSTPVVKTADKTMKITYTITEV